MRDLASTLPDRREPLTLQDFNIRGRRRLAQRAAAYVVFWFVFAILSGMLIGAWL